MKDAPRIPGYEVLGRLGEGGMGVVFRGRFRASGEPVALKVLPEALSTAETEARLLREAILTSALRHPNICQITGSGEAEDGRFFLAMELCPGETVAQRLPRKEMGLVEAVGIALQAAEGLAAAHEQGVIHRDIKPANLMLLPGGEVKILDFGLARLEAAASSAISAEVVGTIPYTSPEQLRGGEAEGRSDLWSLGVVLYEMVTGYVPFRGGGRLEVIEAVLRADPRPVSEYVPDPPQALQEILDGTLAKEPDSRFAEADLLAAKLRRLKVDLVAAADRTPAGEEGNEEKSEEPRSLRRLFRFFL